LISHKGNNRAMGGDQLGDKHHTKNEGRFLARFKYNSGVPSAQKTGRGLNGQPDKSRAGNGGYNSLRIATPSCHGLEEANELLISPRQSKSKHLQ